METELIKFDLFKNFTADEIKDLMQNTFVTKREYKKSDIIVNQDDTCDALILLYLGKTVSEMLNSQGRYIVIEELSAPKIFAPAFLFAPNNSYPVSVTALEPCKTVLIQRNDFVHLMQINTKLLFNFLGIVSQQTMFLSNKIKMLGLNRLKENIVHFILEQCGEKNSFENPYTQQEIADRFGVARPSFARVIAELVQDDMISIDRKTIIIHNKQALKNLIQ